MVLLHRIAGGGNVFAELLSSLNLTMALFVSRACLLGANEPQARPPPKQPICQDLILNYTGFAKTCSDTKLHAHIKC